MNVFRNSLTYFLAAIKFWKIENALLLCSCSFLFETMIELGKLIGVGNCFVLQTFRRLLLKQCEEEFNNRTKASQGNLKVLTIAF